MILKGQIKPQRGVMNYKFLDQYLIQAVSQNFFKVFGVVQINNKKKILDEMHPNLNKLSANASGESPRKNVRHRYRGLIYLR